MFAPALNHTVETIAFYLTRGSNCRVRIVTNFKGDETSELPARENELRACSDWIVTEAVGHFHI
jgi:hypothetical protein